MANPLHAIRFVMDHLVHRDKIVSEHNISNAYVLIGTLNTGAKLGKNYINMAETLAIAEDEDVQLGDIDCKDMTNREIYLAAICSYRAFALNEHHKYTKKAVNFRTDTLQISGLTERAKELMRIVWWCDTQIEKTTQDILMYPEDENGNISSVIGGLVVEMAHLGKETEW